MSDSVWIVVQEGVYRHTIYGPFTGDLAHRAAQWLAAHDIDGHHSYRPVLLEGGNEDSVGVEYAQELPPHRLPWGSAIRIPRHPDARTEDLMGGPIPSDFDE